MVSRPGWQTIALLGFVIVSTSTGQVTRAQNTEAFTAKDLPWSAPIAQPETRELTFTSRGAKLSGTLWLPAGKVNSPVVIAYHAASDPLRDAPLYRHLVDMLPPLGVGVFLYDRRGAGRSGGPSANGSFDLLAEDGIAARRMLEGEPGVDPDRIGYWGLSQGGWLAALAAQRDRKCAFAILVSAPMVTADEQMRFAVANILRIRGYDQSAIEQAVGARNAVDEFMRGRLSRDEAQRIVNAAATQPWFDLIYLDRNFRDPNVSGWAEEMRNDPLTALNSVRAPTLVLYGAADPWVPVEVSRKRLAPLASARSNLTMQIVGGADHAMMTSATPLAQVDPSAMAHQSPEAPAYFAVMTNWLALKNITTRP